MHVANPIVVNKPGDTKPEDESPADSKPGDAKLKDAENEHGKSAATESKNVKLGVKTPERPNAKHEDEKSVHKKVPHAQSLGESHEKSGDRKSAHKTTHQRATTSNDQQKSDITKKDAKQKSVPKKTSTSKSGHAVIDIGEDVIARGPIASISPTNLLTFRAAPDHNSNTTAIISVTSLIENPLSYKIRCKTPTAYLVRSSMGFITGRSSVAVRVTLLKGGYHRALHKDTFKVAVTQIEDNYLERFDKLDEIWRSTPKDPTRYMEITLKCNLDRSVPHGLKRYEPVDDATLLKNFHTARNSHIGLISKGLHHVDRLSVQLTGFIRCQLCLAVVVLLCSAAIIYIYFFTGSLVRYPDAGKSRQH